MNYIYLHGFCSSPQSYKATFFEKKFSALNLKLIIPDLNQGDFTHLTISRQLEQVEREMAKFSGPVTLLGSSLGGFLASLIAEDEERVSRLVLMAPAFSFVSRYFELADGNILKRWRESGYHHLHHFGYDRECPLHYKFIEDARVHEGRNLGRQLPAQIFHGLQDESVPATLSRDYLDTNRAAHLIYINDDHSLAGDLDLMWDYMRAFLGLGTE